MSRIVRTLLGAAVAGFAIWHSDLPSNPPTASVQRRSTLSPSTSQAVAAPRTRVESIWEQYRVSIVAVVMLIVLGLVQFAMLKLQLFEQLAPVLSVFMGAVLMTNYLHIPGLPVIKWIEPPITFLALAFFIVVVTKDVGQSEGTVSITWATVVTDMAVWGNLLALLLGTVWPLVDYWLAKQRPQPGY